MSDDRCWVCDEAADDTNSAICHGCGQRFHLNLRNDLPGKDCGDVWINDQTIALEFGCLPCIRGETAHRPPVEEVTSPQRRRMKRPFMPRPERRRYRRQMAG